MNITNCNNCPVLSWFAALSSSSACSLDVQSVGQARDEIVRWEEGKKWQAKMEKMKNSVKEKERENESLSKQLSTLKDLYARSVYTSCVTKHTLILLLC